MRVRAQSASLSIAKSEELSYADLAPCAAPEEVVHLLFHTLATANAAKRLDLSALSFHPEITLLAHFISV